MADWPREIFVDLTSSMRIRYGRSERPPIRYAISLETYVESEWTTLRLWDNAHDPDEHHEHGYTRSSGKEDPVVHPFRTCNEAMAAAIARAGNEWQAILAAWSNS